MCVNEAPQGEDQATGDAHLSTVQQGRTRHPDQLRSSYDPRLEGTVVSFRVTL